MAAKLEEFLLENELKMQLKSNNLLPCYLLFGEEQYLIRNYVKNIISMAVTGYEEFNVDQFDGAVKVQNVYDSVTAFPMMSERKCVTLCDFPVDKAPNAEFEKLLVTVRDVPSTSVLVLWFETIEISPKKPGEKFSKLFKAIREAGGAICNINRKSQMEIIKILQTGAVKRKCHIDASVARYMTEVCSTDLNTLVNELEKLCAYVSAGGTITQRTVDEVCSRSTEASVYNVSKVLLRGNLSEAYKLLDDLLYMNTEPAYILNILSSAYVDMYRSFAANSAGKKAETIAKDFGYYNNAFRLSDAERNLRKFDEAKLTKALSLISDCDRSVKANKGDGRVLIEKLMAELVILAG